MRFPRRRVRSDKGSFFTLIWARGTQVRRSQGELQMATQKDAEARATKGTALITGASSGIGAVYADRLARRGYDLILVARNAKRLSTLARRIENETGRTVETVVADLTATEDLHRVEDILRTNPHVSLLVNNAGLGAVAPLVEAD